MPSPWTRRGEGPVSTKPLAQVHHLPGEKQDSDVPETLSGSLPDRGRPRAVTGRQLCRQNGGHTPSCVGDTFANRFSSVLSSGFQVERVSDPVHHERAAGPFLLSNHHVAERGRMPEGCRTGLIQQDADTTCVVGQPTARPQALRCCEQRREVGFS